MKNTLFLSVLFSFFFYSNITAQSNNKETILGCWEVRQVIFTETYKGSDEESEEISMDAIGSVVCFDNKGKFANKKGEITLTGDYKLSENGRTLFQSSDNELPNTNAKDEEIPGSIVYLSETELQIQAEEIILYFRKSN